ncbi:hypothetical protein OPT61_g5203 [Boeremia exigua]|uniref:Uncharacterized protein n=1 Tax=Boeremia exigua TaxID=749465 RepID=A0ACC2IBA5_9PLEO|nr:hypothetical protein OPT61_g5203 [Boeremia exigua]
MPLFRTDIPPIPHVSATLKTIASITTAPAMEATATDSPAFLSISAIIPPLPSNFTSPLATGKVPTPAIAIVALIAAIVCALILLLALLYFILLRFRGKCPNCSGYEDGIKKWKNGELKVITSQMVQERMRAWDLEKDETDLQAQTYSLWTEDSDNNDKGKEETVETPIAETKPPDPPKRAYTEGNTGATLAVPDFPRTHSAYLRDVVAPREAEVKRSMREAEEHAISRHLQTASDPSKRQSVQQRAVDKVNEIIVERAARKETGKKPVSQSRLKEHLSWV